MKTPRQVAETVHGFLGFGGGKVEPYSFMLYRSTFVFLCHTALNFVNQKLAKLFSYLHLIVAEIECAKGKVT